MNQSPRLRMVNRLCDALDAADRNAVYELIVEIELSEDFRPDDLEVLAARALRIYSNTPQGGGEPGRDSTPYAPTERPQHQPPRLTLETAAKLFEIVLRIQVALNPPNPAAEAVNAEYGEPPLRLPWPGRVQYLRLSDQPFLAEILHWVQIVGLLKPEHQLQDCTPGVANWLITEARNLRREIRKEQNA